MKDTRSIGVLKFAGGLSGHLHPIHATEQVCQQCAQALDGAAPDLAMVLFSTHHIEAARAISYAVQKRLNPRCLIGVSAESVIGGETEFEGIPGISMLAASLPGVELSPFRVDDLMGHLAEEAQPELAAAAGMTGAPGANGAGEGNAESGGGGGAVGGGESGGRGGGGGALGGGTPGGGEYRATILVADPFSVPMNALLPALSRARPAALSAGDHQGPARRGPIIGGMASSATKAGGNVMLLGDKVIRAGGVGVTLRGNVRVDSLVSQGCRPFGPPLLVTGGKGQIITTLGGKPALHALAEAIETLDEHGKKLLQRGIFIGRAISEYKERFGRDDFLIRGVIGVDRNTEALAVAELLRIGQTIQFHLRDADTADEDLAMLLDMQRLYDPPAGALLFTCNARGKRLFDKAHHDASAIAHAFNTREPGETESKGGIPIPDIRPVLPLAGIFAAGEIGPIGDEVFLHGQTASVALFRSA